MGSAFADLAGHFIRFPKGQEAAKQSGNFKAFADTPDINAILCNSVVYLMCYQRYSCLHYANDVAIGFPGFWAMLIVRLFGYRHRQITLSLF